MAELSTMPMVRCRRCGEFIAVTHLSTTMPDPDGEMLFALLEMTGKRALCPDCQAAHDYYAAHGRGEDWEAGRC